MVTLAPPATAAVTVTFTLYDDLVSKSRADLTFIWPLDDSMLKSLALVPPSVCVRS